MRAACAILNSLLAAVLLAALHVGWPLDALRALHAPCFSFAARNFGFRAQPAGFNRQLQGGDCIAHDGLGTTRRFNIRNIIPNQIKFKCPLPAHGCCSLAHRRYLSSVSRGKQRHFAPGRSHCSSAGVLRARDRSMRERPPGAMRPLLRRNLARAAAAVVSLGVRPRCVKSRRP